MMHHRARLSALVFAVSLGFAGAIASQHAQAQNSPVSFEPFDPFIRGVQNAAARTYVGRTDSRVRNAAEFERMRQHILYMYRDTPVINSYALGGQIFDCIPVTKQPSVRILGLTEIASPPPRPDRPIISPPSVPQVAPQQKVDAFGNSIGCTPGNIPMRRLTLETMTRFETLERFFAKGPNGAGQAHAIPPTSPIYSTTIKKGTYDPATGEVALTFADAIYIFAGNSVIISNAKGTGSFAKIDGTWGPVSTTGNFSNLTLTVAKKLTMTITGGDAATPGHQWAESYQNVTNHGGGHNLNVWSPAVNTKATQVFSLSQHWFINPKPLFQTAEAGWQVFPQQYGTSEPVLFTYWTSNNYNPNTGCYNLDCPGFVQTNKAAHLGAPIPSSISSAAGPCTLWTEKGPSPNAISQSSCDSVTDGDQYYIYLERILDSKGNWWLYTQFEPVGYYPPTLYKGGNLATSASEIEFGGETVGTTSWPLMGSGAFASKGFGVAAFQNGIYYSPTPGKYQNAFLTATQTAPSCYTNLTHNDTSEYLFDGWGTYLFFGGPGAAKC